MRKIASIFPVCTLFFLVSISVAKGAGTAYAAQSRPADYFSTGQAVYDPQDRAKSQQNAVRDFMVQGLTQAIGSLMSPAQMGARFAEIQKTVLAKPEKYINSYQVFSQEQAGQTFRVAGQVTVSMEALKEDLVKAGILSGENQPQPASPPSPQVAQTQQPEQPSLGSQSADLGPESAPAETQQPQQPSLSPQSSVARDDLRNDRTKLPGAGPEVLDLESSPAQEGRRGIAPTKREILWAVAEKWEQEWVLPTDIGDVRSLFTRSLGREMDDFDFSILMPQPGSVRMDFAGNIPASQVISLAEGLGIADVVVGKVSYHQARYTGQARLEANLRLIRIAQGKSEFELHKAQSMDDLSNQEGAAELARQIAPQLNSLLGGPQTPRSQRGGQPGAFPPAESSSAQAENIGPLLVYLPSDQYPRWMELERVLREQFKTMTRTSLEIGATETFVKLDGVSAVYLLKMNGARLPSGVTVSIDSYSTDTQTVKVSFAPPQKAQGDQSAGD